MPCPGKTPLVRVSHTSTMSPGIWRPTLPAWLDSRVDFPAANSSHNQTPTYPGTSSSHGLSPSAGRGLPYANGDPEEASRGSVGTPRPHTTALPGPTTTCNDHNYTTPSPDAHTHTSTRPYTRTPVGTHNLAGLPTTHHPARTPRATAPSRESHQLVLGRARCNRPPAETKKKTTRARITIASLNTRGRSQNGCLSEVSKWMQIHQLIRDNGVGILAVQESHLSQAHVDDIHRLFGRRLRVLTSSDPTDPTRARGIAFVLNKDRTNINEVSMQELIPGRAALLTT